MIRRSRYILLLADFDGTLSAIAAKPHEARPVKGVRGILKRLSKNKRFYIGIISGRRLSNVKKLLNLDGGLYYAGNHGLEIRGPGINFVHPSVKRGRSHLDKIRKELIYKVKSIKGAIVEYKIGSLSLHYRLVKKRYIKKLRDIFTTVTVPYLKKGRINLFSGKKVWEIRLPVRWNKGSAVGKILSSLGRNNILPVYMGDDITDEDAFSFLKKKKSITIFVGKKKKSKAAYFLNSPNEARELLSRLCRI